MRGKVCTYSATEHGYGITPAYAGKSRPDPEPDAGTGDHPRVCGEKSAPMYPVPPVTGSPPRMRGKEKREVDEKQPCGITPAYAGKSAISCANGRQFLDHPRVCGEKRDFSRLPPFLQGSPRVCGEKRVVKKGAVKLPGSPPRMRGKDYCGNVRSKSPRITPAYAGKRHLSDIALSVRQDHPRVCGEKF